MNIDEIFTTDPKSTWVHLLPWGTLGEAFPFFKPNYRVMEEYGKDMGADEVTTSLRKVISSFLHCCYSSDPKCKYVSLQVVGWVPTG